jgi:hypothetical protein
MKVLAVGQPRAGIDARAAIAPHAREELAVLWRLYATGTVREMYSPHGPGAVLVLETESIAAARVALGELPLVANEIVDFELIELLPFAAFASLFAAPEAT